MKMRHKLPRKLTMKSALGVIALCLISMTTCAASSPSHTSQDLWQGATPASVNDLSFLISDDDPPCSAIESGRGRVRPVTDLQSCHEADELSIPEFEGTIIDDLSGHFSQLGPAKYWHEEAQGYNDHSWWTRNNQSVVENTARWTLDLGEPGTYEVYVYIPTEHATTRQANYLIFHGGESNAVSVNQNALPNSWHKLGDFAFDAVSDEYIELMDKTGEQDAEFEIAFDAVGLIPHSDDLEEKITGAFWERIQPWLDEKTEKLQESFKDWLDEQKGKFLRQLADSLKSWIDQQCAGLGAAMLFPIFAFILWRRGQRKS
jgi:hypothetical protein